MLHLCQITGIKSNVCLIEGYEDWFFVDKFKLSVQNPGGSVEDVAFSGLELTKTIDSSSPQLMNICCKGAVFGPLEIVILETSGVGTSGKIHPVFKMKFGRLKLKSWSIDKTTETIDFAYLQAACQFWQGKCDRKTLETTYQTTNMMGFQLYTAADNQRRRGGEWKVT